MAGRHSVIFALGIALLLATTPVYLFPHAGQPEYHHSVEQVSKSDIPDEADVLRFENLSDNGQTAVRDALTDDGVVYGEKNKPSEFVYSDVTTLGQGLYYVQKGGTYFRLYTYAGGGILPIRFILLVTFVMLGISVALMAFVSLRSGRDWYSVGAGVYGLLLWVSAVQPWVSVSRAGLLLWATAGVVGFLAMWGHWAIFR